MISSTQISRQFETASNALHAIVAQYEIRILINKEWRASWTFQALCTLAYYKLAMPVFHSFLRPNCIILLLFLLRLNHIKRRHHDTSKYRQYIRTCFWPFWATTESTEYFFARIYMEAFFFKTCKNRMCNDNDIYHVSLKASSVIHVFHEALLGTRFLKVWCSPWLRASLSVVFSCWLMEVHIIGILTGFGDACKETRTILYIPGIFRGWCFIFPYFLDFYIANKTSYMRVKCNAK